MEVDGIITGSVGGITGERDIAVFFFIDVRVIGLIGGRIKLPLVNGAPIAVTNDEIIATNGILDLVGAFSVNAIISFKIHLTTLITTEFIMIYRNYASANFNSFLDRVEAIL